jgi:hypothetical protein
MDDTVKGFRFCLFVSYVLAFFGGIPYLLMRIAPQFMQDIGLFGSWEFRGSLFGIAWLFLVFASLPIYRRRALWMLIGAPSALLGLTIVVLIMIACARGPYCI